MRKLEIVLDLVELLWRSLVFTQNEQQAVDKAQARKGQRAQIESVCLVSDVSLIDVSLVAVRWLSEECSDGIKVCRRAVAGHSNGSRMAFKLSIGNQTVLTNAL